MNRPIYPILTTAAIVIMGLIVFALRQYLPHSNIDLAPRKPPAVVLLMEDAYIVGLGHNGKQWSTQAQRVEIGQDRSITRLTGIHAGKVFDKDKVMLKVKAGSAVYNSFTKDLTLKDGVEITGRQGQKITSSGADWNSATQTLRSAGRVDLQTNSGTATTGALRVDLKSREMDMWNVEGRFKVESIPGGLQEAITNAH